MNGVSLSSKVIYWNPKDFAVSQNFWELTEQEKGLVNIFASAQEIDSATASAKLQADIGEEIFRQMGQSGISPIPSFEVSIGIDGKAEVGRQSAHLARNTSGGDTLLG